MDLARALVDTAEKYNFEGIIETGYPLKEESLDNVDLVCVIGGDGTLLCVVDATSARSIPVIGVNLGRLGFMASFSPQEMKADLEQIILGNYSLYERTLIEATDAHNNSEISLNDIAIKAAGSRLIRLEVFSDQELVNTYHADGLIFSSPTGSTAYNLSAGGPIVHPEAGVLIVTPINPHTLSTRPIVLDEKHALTVNLVGDPSDVRVSGDGRDIFGPNPAFPINLRIAPNRRFLLVQHKNYSHYFVLRNKLGWTGNAVFHHSSPSQEPSRPTPPSHAPSHAPSPTNTRPQTPQEPVPQHKQAHPKLVSSSIFSPAHKRGCLLIFLLGVILFIGLFWILPYLS